MIILCALFGGALLDDKIKKIPEYIDNIKEDYSYKKNDDLALSPLDSNSDSVLSPSGTGIITMSGTLNLSSDNELCNKDN